MDALSERKRALTDTVGYQHIILDDVGTPMIAGTIMKVVLVDLPTFHHLYFTCVSIIYFTCVSIIVKAIKGTDVCLDCSYGLS